MDLPQPRCRTSDQNRPMQRGSFPPKRPPHGLSSSFACHRVFTCQATRTRTSRASVPNAEAACRTTRFGPRLISADTTAAKPAILTHHPSASRNRITAKVGQRAATEAFRGPSHRPTQRPTVVVRAISLSRHRSARFRNPLLAFELGLAFLDEGSNAFLFVFAREA